MRKDIFTKIWLVVLIVTLISLSIWGIFYVDNVDSKISILGIVALIIAAFTSVMTVNINNKKTREREYELHILKEKQKVAEHYYNMFFEIFNNVKKNKKGINNKVLEEMSLFKKGLMNWGSEDLIKKYIEYEDALNSGEKNPGTAFVEGNKILKEIRKELGFKDSKNLNLMNIILTAEARKEMNLE